MLFDGHRRAAVGVALPEHRVHSAAQDFGVARLRVACARHLKKAHQKGTPYRTGSIRTLLRTPANLLKVVVMVVGVASSTILACSGIS